MIPVAGTTRPGTRARPADQGKWIPDLAPRAYHDLTDPGAGGSAMSREMNSGGETPPGRTTSLPRGREAAAGGGHEVDRVHGTGDPRGARLRRG